MCLLTTTGILLGMTLLLNMNDSIRTMGLWRKCIKESEIHLQCVFANHYWYAVGDDLAAYYERFHQDNVSIEKMYKGK